MRYSSQVQLEGDGDQHKYVTFLHYLEAFKSNQFNELSPH